MSDKHQKDLTDLIMAQITLTIAFYQWPFIIWHQWYMKSKEYEKR